MSSVRTAHRLSRILGMLPWVIGHPGVTVSEVCERFGYTRAELARDLELVFVCGMPGYGPGDLMDAYIDGDEVVVDMADYFSRPLRLTPAEALVLLAGGMVLLSSGAAPEALATAVAKLQTVLMPEVGALAVDPPAAPALVGLLGKAAGGGEVVEITHTSLASGATTIRLVEPWRVFSTLGNWYLVGYCRLAADERIFRIDRIQRAVPTGELFSPSDEPLSADVRYTPGVDDAQAVIRLRRPAAWVADYYPVESLGSDGQGDLVRFSASDAAVTARLLVRLGADADLVEGAEVAAAVADLRMRVLGRYRRSADQ
jgi:proteasome accessory factor C